MSEKTEIQKVESPLTAAANLIEQSDGKIDVDKLAKLLEVQKDWEAMEAKKAYVQAMSNFKANPPEITKDQKVSYGNTKYNHASLANVTSCINKALSEHGLTASWVTEQVEKDVKVTCKITHVLGHSEETSLAAPPDDSGKKNYIQAIGSTVTYLQRYTILALTGLATYEADDDGQGAGSKGSIKFPDPTEDEMQVIAEICALLKPEPGFMVNPVLVAKVFYAERKEYPPDDCDRARAAKWLWNLGRDIFVKDNRSDLEKKYDMPGDEDSRPDANEELRYYCKGCDNEFDELKNNKCPKCQRKAEQVVDRRPE